MKRIGWNRFHSKKEWTCKNNIIINAIQSERKNSFLFVSLLYLGYTMLADKSQWKSTAFIKHLRFTLPVALPSFSFHLNVCFSTFLCVSHSILIKTKNFSIERILITTYSFPNTFFFSVILSRLLCFYSLFASIHYEVSFFQFTRRQWKHVKGLLMNRNVISTNNRWWYNDWAQTNPSLFRLCEFFFLSLNL